MDGQKLSGTNVWQYEFNSSDAQKWLIVKNTDGTYSIVAKSSGLCLDINAGIIQNNSNMQVYSKNGTNAQKFKFEEITNSDNNSSNTDDNTNNNDSQNTSTKTIENGTYTIETAVSSSYAIDVNGGSRENGANIQIYKKQAVNRQKFNVEYIGDGYYKILAVHSNKALDVCGAEKKSGTNVWQYEFNNSDAQKWKIQKNTDNTYSLISKCNGLYLDLNGGSAQNCNNIHVYEGNNSIAQKFRFVEPLNLLNTIDASKYPGYKERISKLMEDHPGWNFELLYTNLNFSSAVYGEYSNHSANLVPSSSGSEWICPVCGTKLYDTGWYGASDKAIAYYMDPRNFLNDSNVFQFLDANKYEPTSVSLDGIQVNVNGTFLQNYASDINTACRNQGVNPYYVISRLIQENGKNGSTTSRGMDGGNGKTYYNPFNIGATGSGRDQVIANALAKAKANGWDTMEKALEGGIVFLKANWLENYQNTLYQNRFDIDSTNGTSLYSHQYMQNLSAAYSEGNLLRGYYTNAGKIDSNLTFIIPMYEGMSINVSPRPSEGTSSEEYPMNVVVNTSSSTLALRSGANTSSTVIGRYPKGTVLLSVQRGINSTWQHVVTKDGKTGYMSGEYLKQVNDEYLCNYKAYIKTQSSGGLSVRTGPSTTEGFSKVDYLPDYTEITVIDDSTYKGYEGSDWVQWSRIILPDGRQAFVPSGYVKRK